MIVLEHVKVHMLSEVQGQTFLNYWGTSAGQELWNKLHNSRPNGSTFNIAEDMEVAFDFAYGYPLDIVKPNRNPEFNVYKKPTAQQIRDYAPVLIQNIETFKPDIVIPMSPLACKTLVNSTKIGAVRGKPEKHTYGSHECWVLPTYSMDSVQVVKNNEPLQTIDLEMVMEFLERGEERFIPKEVAYTTYTNKDYDACIAVLDKAIETQGKSVVEAVAWDLETNTLRPEYKGSKILSFSLSMEHGTGYTMPVDHWEQPWEPEQREAILAKIFKFISADIYKIGANIQFDMRFTKMKSKEHLYCVKNLDIQAGYYIAVSQDEESSKGLKTLAYYYTDMGGYDSPVEDYKVLFQKVQKALGKIYGKEKKVEEWVNYLEKGFYALGIDKPDFMTEEDIEVMTTTINRLISEQETTKFVNPVDGENYTYEWIPYRLLAEYASGDVDATRRIGIKVYEDEVCRYDKWIPLYTEHFPELMDTLADMEVTGMQVDETRLNEIKEAFELKKEEIYEELKSNELVKQLEELKASEYMKGLEEKAKPVKERDKAVYKLYEKYRKEEDRKLKVTSPTDKGLLLFGLTGYTLEPTKETLKDGAFQDKKNGVLKPSDINWSHFKTDEGNVKALMEKYGDFKLGKILLEYAKAEKLVSTYTQSILDITDEDTIVHGFIKSTRTATSTWGR